MLATPMPIPADQRIALLGMRDPRRLPDGRVSALVTIDNPALHTHGPVLGTPGAGTQTESAWLVFAWVGDRWLIDEVVR